MWHGPQTWEAVRCRSLMDEGDKVEQMKRNFHLSWWSVLLLHHIALRSEREAGGVKQPTHRKVSTPALPGWPHGPFASPISARRGNFTVSNPECLSFPHKMATAQVCQLTFSDNTPGGFFPSLYFYIPYLTPLPITLNHPTKKQFHWLSVAKEILNVCLFPHCLWSHLHISYIISPDLLLLLVQLLLTIAIWCSVSCCYPDVEKPDAWYSLLQEDMVIFICVAQMPQCRAHGLWGRTAGEMTQQVERAGCPPKGPGFKSQHPHSEPLLSVAPVPGNSMLPSGSHEQQTCMYRQEKHCHTRNNIE